MNRNDLARFFAKVHRSRTTDCWVWMACNDGRYGHFKFEGRTAKAHRVAYLHFVGAVPDGLELDHLCLNKLCVNPSHLEPVTHDTNLKRWAAQLTGCRRYGHPLDGLTVLSKTGKPKRYCKTCMRLNGPTYCARYHAKRRRAAQEMSA